ncbi:hypothetical protein C7M84_004323 [Penaeus vannamei]|uniref:Uncharacterized protein n=1 Tax=Penaeus vannamei TaxID=6689 RepID=A0A423TKP9_PENVA|nr:hypothetical protein C7M84_004323 [Penaeus vannamei]
MAQAGWLARLRLRAALPCFHFPLADFSPSPSDLLPRSTPPPLYSPFPSLLSSLFSRFPLPLALSLLPFSLVLFRLSLHPLLSLLALISFALSASARPPPLSPPIPPCPLSPSRPFSLNSLSLHHPACRSLLVLVLSPSAHPLPSTPVLGPLPFPPCLLILPFLLSPAPFPLVPLSLSPSPSPCPPRSWPFAHPFFLSLSPSLSSSCPFSASLPSPSSSLSLVSLSSRLFPLRNVFSLRLPRLGFSALPFLTPSLSPFSSAFLLLSRHPLLLFLSPFPRSPPIFLFFSLRPPPPLYRTFLNAVRFFPASSGFPSSPTPPALCSSRPVPPLSAFLSHCFTVALFPFPPLRPTLIFPSAPAAFSPPTPTSSPYAPHAVARSPACSSLFF